MTATAPALHPSLEPIAGLLGTWEGHGSGSYPTIDDFSYREEVVIGHVGKPFLTYQQRTWALDDGRPLHAEVGYLRLPQPDRIEWVISHPTGITEIDEGTVTVLSTGILVHLVSSSVALTATAVEVTALERTLWLTADELQYDLSMAAVGHRLTHHLTASLARRPTP